MLRPKLGWVTVPFPLFSFSVSVFRFDLRLDFFNAVELFFVRFKRLRQDRGRSRMGCPQEALLERLIHPLVVLDHMQLALGQHVTARFLLLDFLDAAEAGGGRLDHQGGRRQGRGHRWRSPG